MKGLATRIEAWLDEGDYIRDALWAEGPGLVNQAVEKFGSLRAAAKALAVSGTYVCHVRARKVRISPGCFVRLAGLLK